MSREADALLIQAGELLVKVAKSIADLEARVAALEAERAMVRPYLHQHGDGTRWQTPPVTCGAPTYEHYVDPSMRDTHNGNR